MPDDIALGGRRLVEQVCLLHKAASGAYYNHGNCLTLAAAAARVLAACLASGEVLQSARYVIQFDELLREVTDFISVFSRRCACSIYAILCQYRRMRPTCLVSTGGAHVLQRRVAGPG